MAAVVLVRKKDDSLRCFVDDRVLKKLITNDSYPLTQIDDTLDALMGSKWFSTLGMKSGRHQVKMTE